MNFIPDYPAKLTPRESMITTTIGAITINFFMLLTALNPFGFFWPLQYSAEIEQTILNALVWVAGGISGFLAVSWIGVLAEEHEYRNNARELPGVICDGMENAKNEIEQLRDDSQVDSY